MPKSSVFSFRILHLTACRNTKPTPVENPLLLYCMLGMTQAKRRETWPQLMFLDFKISFGVMDHHQALSITFPAIQVVLELLKNFHRLRELCE